MTEHTQISASEMVQSLTGFEEIAIEKHMGIDPYADGETKPLKVLRALLFVQATREGMTAPAAREHAMGLAMGAVQDRFVEEEEPEDLDPDEPETEAGKDDSHFD